MIRRTRTWTENELRKAVLSATSYRQVLKKLKLVPAGGNYTQIKKYVGEYNIPTIHFKGKGWNKGMTGIGKPIIPLSDILIKHSTYQSYKLKKRLFNEKIKQPHCEMCGWSKTTIDGRLPLELDHINGNKNDNRIENLRILCPNCHSLQPTHRGLNRRKM